MPFQLHVPAKKVIPDFHIWDFPCKQSSPWKNLWIPLELFHGALSTVKSSGSLAGAGSTVLDSPATMSQPKAIESSNDKSAAASNLEGTYCNIYSIYQHRAVVMDHDLHWEKKTHHLHFTHTAWGRLTKTAHRCAVFNIPQEGNPKSSLAMWFEWWHSTSLLWAHISPRQHQVGYPAVAGKQHVSLKNPSWKSRDATIAVYIQYICICKNTITSSCQSCHTLPSLLHATESLPSWNGAMMCHDRVSCSPCLHWFFGWSFGLQVSSHPLGPATPPGVSTSPKRSCNATRTIEGPLKVDPFFFDGFHQLKRAWTWHLLKI